MAIGNLKKISLTIPWLFFIKNSLNFPRLSLTTIFLPDFSKFSRWMGTLLHIVVVCSTPDIIVIDRLDIYQIFILENQLANIC